MHKIKVLPIERLDHSLPAEIILSRHHLYRNPTFGESSRMSSYTTTISVEPEEFRFRVSATYDSRALLFTISR